MLIDGNYKNDKYYDINRKNKNVTNIKFFLRNL